MTDGDILVYLTLKNGMKMCVPANTIDFKMLMRVINASKMQQDQKYNPRAKIFQHLLPDAHALTAPF